MDTTPTQYAGFWRRCTATILDDVITLAVGGMSFTALNFYRFFYSDEGYYFVFAVIFFIVLRWGYSASMESSPLKATIGKLATGLYITKAYGYTWGTNRIDRKNKCFPPQPVYDQKL